MIPSSLSVSSIELVPRRERKGKKLNVTEVGSGLDSKGSVLECETIREWLFLSPPVSNFNFSLIEIILKEQDTCKLALSYYVLVFIKNVSPSTHRFLSVFN